MLVLADNDVNGAVRAIQLVLESKAWASYATLLEVQFTSFEDLGLLHNATDKTVWEKCHAAGVLLVTANRAGGPDSLDEAIRQAADPSALPVLTIGDAQRVLRESSYVEECAFRLLDFIDRIESLRGVGRALHSVIGCFDS